MRFLCLYIVTWIFPLLYQFFDIIDFLLFHQWFFPFRVFYVNLCILILFCFCCVLSFFRNIMEHWSLPTHRFNLIPFHYIYIYIYIIKIRLWIIIKKIIPSFLLKVLITQPPSPDYIATKKGVGIVQFEIPCIWRLGELVVVSISCSFNV